MGEEPEIPFVEGVVLLPEEDVPEKQPAGVHQQRQQREDQRTVQLVVQDALRDDRQKEQPSVLEAQRHLLELVEGED